MAQGELYSIVCDKPLWKMVFHIHIYIYIYLKHCCTAEINTNTVNQQCFNKIKHFKNPSTLATKEDLLAYLLLISLPWLCLDSKV